MSRGKTMFIYKKLWEVMKLKGVTRNDLRNNGVLSSATIAKLGKNERVSIDVIEALCKYLDCQPGDIMEYVSDIQLEEAKDTIVSLQNLIIDLKKKYNISDEDIEESGILEAIKNGSVGALFEEMIHPKDEPIEESKED